MKLRELENEDWGHRANWRQEAREGINYKCSRAQTHTYMQFIQSGSHLIITDPAYLY
jgi:hypothetical protein